MFDFDKYASQCIQFFTSNIYLSIGTVALLVFFLYKKPVETLKTLGFFGLVIAVLYIMSYLSEPGSSSVSIKKNLSEKSKRELLQE